jgi:copper resistance protein B
MIGRLGALFVAGAGALMVLAAGAAFGQSLPADSDNPAPFGPPVDDQHIWVHGLLDQFEARVDGRDTSLRWDGEAWLGPDAWRIWLRSEGEITHDQLTDGQTEVLLSRPISTYVDVLVGGRYDLDSLPGRGWGAFGVNWLAPGSIAISAMGYAGDGVAGRVKASFDQMLTNRLILQSQAEINLYGQRDPTRRIGAGLSDLDAGLRLRYEVTRKFAPYVGVSWQQVFNETALLTRSAGQSTDDVRFTVGVRTWF